MTRNLMIGMSLFTLTSASAIAAPAVHHVAKAKVVAEAPAADTAAPASDKPADKSTKKTKHVKKAKTDATKAEMNTGAAPAGTKAETPKAK